MSRGLFCTDWNPKQEFKLLEALDDYGYGNWSSVSQRVGKLPNECKDHYDHYYINRSHHGVSNNPFYMVKSEQRSMLAPRKLQSEMIYYPGTEISGYMPQRGDFANESDDNAEAIIANLDTEFENDDLMTALNLAAIQIYQSRLRKRAFRKRIVKEYGLLDIHRQTVSDSSRLTRHQLRLKNIMRPFLRFMSPTNAIKFMQSHFLEVQLCSEIKQLQRYRENGITTFKGVKLYERLLSERKRRKISQRNVIKKNCSFEENLLHQVLHQGGPSLKPKKQAKLLDITYSASVEKLDSEEKELCSYCRFQPEAYLQFKRQMISEYKKLEKLTLADARKLLKVDVNKTRKIYDLLVEKKLINNSS